MMMLLYTSTKSTRKSKMSPKRKADAAATEAINKKWAPKAIKTGPSQFKLGLTIPAEQSTNHIPSHDSWSGDTAKKQSPTYTGDKMIGITTLHKSNLVPVFTKDEAIDAASMRR